MYKLHISVAARRKLRKISKNHQRAIIEALQDLKEDPLIGKPLKKELIGRFSYRIGTYRIIYKIDQQNKTVSILSAGHRTMIYQ